MTLTSVPCQANMEPAWNYVKLPCSRPAPPPATALLVAGNSDCHGTSQPRILIVYVIPIRANFVGTVEARRCNRGAAYLDVLLVLGYLRSCGTGRYQQQTTRDKSFHR